MALKHSTDAGPFVPCNMDERVGGRGPGAEAQSVKVGGARAPAQILVRVANTQVKALGAEAEKGSTSPALERGLVGPKAGGFDRRQASDGRCRKGLRLTSRTHGLFGFWARRWCPLS